MEEFNCCRLCLSKTLIQNTLNIFPSKRSLLNDTTVDQTKIRSILHKYCWFLVLEPDDEQSHVICRQCWDIIENFHRFTERIKNVQKQLYFSNLNCSAVDVFLDKIKVEPVELLKNDDEFSEKSWASNDNSNNLSVKNETETKDDIVLSRLWEKSIVSDEQKEIKKILKKKPSPKIPNEKQQKMDDEDALINQYYKRECEICSKNYLNMRKLLQHYRGEHKIRGYLRCCGKKLKQRWEALDHIELHKNPNAFFCNVCNKPYQCHKSLAIHLRQHDETFEQYQCDKCNRLFMKKNSLTWHIRYVHLNENEVKQQFPCDMCNRIFLSDLLRRRHITKRHNKATESVICSVCAKVCPSLRSLQKHHESVHAEDTPKVQCPECQRWFKNPETLRVHGDRHKIQFNTCDVCNREFNSLAMFQAHKRRAHLPLKHWCTICNKAFGLPDVYKKHMAQHRGQLETCLICSKSFMSKHGLDNHIKKYH